ncbi:MAG: hypothetical protein HQL98_15635 [Magnetococcales bacterium]|nr:hypothetical protein [Magnetococcales bacterium]
MTLSLHPLYQLLAAPVSDLLVRLRVLDSDGVPIGPDDAHGLVIQIFAPTGAGLRQLVHVGIPAPLPWVDFVQAGDTVRPFVHDDYLGYGVWRPGVIYLGELGVTASGEIDAVMAAKLNSLGVTDDHNPDYPAKLAEWAAAVAGIKQEIARLKSRIAETTDEHDRSMLMAQLSQQYASLEVYFHGLTTIDATGVTKPARYQDGEYVIPLRRSVLKREFSLSEENGNMVFFIHAHVRSSTPYWPQNANNSLVSTFHPGTWLPGDGVLGSIRIGSAGVAAGRHELTMLPLYHDLP